MTSYYRADPGLFGMNQAIIGWTSPTKGQGDYRQPPEPPDEIEEVAPNCSGPGGLYQPDPNNYDRTPGDLLIKIEDCPDCIGLIRNHTKYRTTKENQ